MYIIVSSPKTLTRYRRANKVGRIQGDAKLSTEQKVSAHVTDKNIYILHLSEVRERIRATGNILKCRFSTPNLDLNPKS